MSSRNGSTGVTVATLTAALALATVSGGFSINGMTSIFTGALYPVIGMGVAIELGKLSAVAWLGRLVSKQFPCSTKSRSKSKLVGTRTLVSSDLMRPDGSKLKQFGANPISDRSPGTPGFERPETLDQTAL